MLHALILSEGVYRAVDEGELAAVEAIDTLQRELALEASSALQAVQWSQPHANQRYVMHHTTSLLPSQASCNRRSGTILECGDSGSLASICTFRYLLATSGDALFCAFMGTKQPRDLLTNGNVLREELWPDAVEATGLTVHRGYLQRARGIPILQIYHQAASQGKRLVLCGEWGAQVKRLSQLRAAMKPTRMHVYPCRPLSWGSRGCNHHPRAFTPPARARADQGLGGWLCDTCIW